MRLNNKEKILLGVLVFVSIIFIVNLIITNPINRKKTNLEAKRQEILNIKNEETKFREDINLNKLISKEDIILEIEKEVKDILNISYINKSVDWDENNNEMMNIELKVTGNLENIFQIEGKLKKLNLNNSIESVEINKIQNNNDENKQTPVECIMTFRVV